MHYDVILVLGRGISIDGDLPNSAKATVQKSSLLFNEGLASHIIFSGKWSRHYDYTPPLTEASAMRAFAIELGIPSESIYLEEESLDTISNLYFVKTKYLLPNNWKKILYIGVSPQEKRAPFLASYILGSDYVFDMRIADFSFPPEKHASLVEQEEKKLATLREFVATHAVQPGDHERIMQLHLDYIQQHVS